MHIKTFYELKLDLLAYVGLPSPNWVSKKRAGQENFFILIPEKNFFNHKHTILVMFTLESKVNFLFVLLHHFLVAGVVLTSHYPLFSVQVILDSATLGRQLN